MGDNWKEYVQEELDAFESYTGKPSMNFTIRQIKKIGELRERVEQLEEGLQFYKDEKHVQLDFGGEKVMDWGERAEKALEVNDD
jgi:hypothetical protein